MKNLKIVEVSAEMMIVLCEEYDKLHFIPDFKTRIDTAKQNFKNRMEQKCKCSYCTDEIIFIMNLKFYEDDKTNV